MACLNRADQHHAKAVAFASRWSGRMVTTRFVLIEVADALAGSATRLKVPAFINALENDANVSIFEPRPALLQRALRLYEERPDKEWTLTDCISFVIMADEGLTDALTGDRHFEQAGFRAVLK